MSYTYFSNKTKTVLLTLTIISLAGVLHSAFADVPITPTTPIVECTCVTSDSQTCVTVKSDFTTGDTYSACDTGGNYIASDIQGSISRLGAWVDPQATGNVYVANGSLVQECILPSLISGNYSTGCTSPFPIFNNTTSMLPSIIGDIITGTITTIGYDSGLACHRAASVRGTLHLTGIYYSYFSIGGPGGDGSAGGNFDSSWVRSASNYSCY
jgi:hypothetical protein